jgi:hypothetical protein
MYKKTFTLSALFIALIFIAESCKKTGAPPVKPNSPHALSDIYYFRSLLDTTWVYQGNSNRQECQTSGSVCADFLTYGFNGSLAAVKFTLTDSAHANPSDTTLLSWVGRSFVTASDTATTHAYIFNFEYPDSTGRKLSSDYIFNNTGARLTIDSVVYDGLSKYYLDTAGYPFKSYRIKGTLSCKVAYFGDTTKHTIAQGVYSINVIPAQ